MYIWILIYYCRTVLFCCCFLAEIETFFSQYTYTNYTGFALPVESLFVVT